jgi:hypothetical protein
MTVAVAEASEEQLISRAQDAVSHCRWVVGECAAQWTKRYSRGRTDADFALSVGLSPDQVFQRRRVWERFAKDREEYHKLKWSHFYSALNWDDAVECLLWAEENEATVAEMKAWRRARRGEDLNEPADDELFAAGAVSFVPTELQPVLDPSGEAGGRNGGPRSSNGAESTNDRLVGVARQMDGEGTGDAYSPYRADAMTVPSNGAGAGGATSAATSSEPVSTEQLVRKMTSQFERFAKIMTPAFAKEFRQLPEGTRSKFLKVVAELSSKAADLM